MYNMKQLFFALFLLTAYGVLPAQSVQSGLGTWNVVNVQYQANERWSLFGEAQLRSLRLYDHFHYYEYKAGFTYRIDKYFSFTAGIGDYDTYREGGDFVTPRLNNETRTWLQVNMRQYLDRLKFEHRYRAEQRWSSNGFRHRFRYRLQMLVPLNQKVIKPGTVYAGIWNELFFTNRAPYFERNRFFIGGGYALKPWLNLEAGWIHQFDFRLDDEIGRDFLQITMQFRLTRTESPRSESVPNTEQ